MPGIHPSRSRSPGANGAAIHVDSRLSGEAIYAYKNSERRLETGICSRTRPPAHAAEDIAYLRAIPELPATADIRVSVFDDGPRQASRRPMPKVRTTISGPDGLREALTDGAGRANFAGVPPGECVQSTLTVIDQEIARQFLQVLMLNVPRDASVAFRQSPHGGGSRSAPYTESPYPPGIGHALTQEPRFFAYEGRPSVLAICMLS